MLDDPELTASQASLQAGFGSEVMGPFWVQRFNAEGRPGLQDRPRRGRKPTHAPEVRSALISLAEAIITNKKPDLVYSDEISIDQS